MARRVDHLKRVIEEEKSSIVRYIGETLTHDAQEDDPVWLVRRKLKIGNLEYVDWSSNIEKYVSKWSERENLFPEVPFGNSFSLVFDGVDDHVTFGHSSTVNFASADSFSWSTWIRRATGATNVRPIVSNMTSTNKGHAIFFVNSKLRVNLQVTGAAQIIVETTNTLETNTWKHIVCTYDGSRAGSGVTIYVDGVSVPVDILTDALGSNEIADGSSTLNIGRSGTTYFFGNIDEVSVWDKVLSPSEVSALYNSGTPTNIVVAPFSNSMLHWWRMGEGDVFPIISDNVGSLDGAMTNMAPGDITEDNAGDS